MNDKKRIKLKSACEYLVKAADIVSEVLDEEQDCLANMPDNLQYSDKYERMEAAVGELEDGLNDIETAQEHILEAVN